MRFPVLQLAGTPYLQGFHHGRDLRHEIEKNIELHFDLFERFSGLTMEEAIARAGQFTGAIQSLNPEYFDGICGIADGSGHDLPLITALNVHPEIVRKLGSPVFAGDGATGFAALPPVSATAQCWMGQNLDGPPLSQLAVVRTLHESGIETIGVHEAGVFAPRCGLNSLGLGLCTSVLSSSDDNWARLGKPFAMSCYEALLAEDAAGAEASLAGDASRSASATFLVASANGATGNIDASPRRSHAYRSENFLVFSDHFRDPEAMEVAEAVSGKDSYVRSIRMESLIRDFGAMSLGAAQSILRDHEGHPDSICRHEDMAQTRWRHRVTVSSVIINLNERLLWVSEGPPCLSRYRFFSLREPAGEASSVRSVVAPLE